MILEIPKLPFLSMKSKQGPDTFSERPHTHEELSIGIILSGSTCVTVEGLNFSLKEGDLIVIPPDFAHLCIPSDPDRFNFHMLYFNPSWFIENTGMDAHLIAPHSPRASSQWKEFFARLTNGRDLDSMEQELSGALISLLPTPKAASANIKAHNRKGPPTDNGAGGAPEFDKVGRTPHGGCSTDENADSQPLLDNVHRIITENPERTLSIKEMASFAGMSKYDFLRKYSRRYGLTPHSSLTDGRIRKALTLMRKNDSLTDIAQDCGFSDQSHFIRQFKRYTGILPSEYQKAISSNRNTVESL